MITPVEWPSFLKYFRLTTGADVAHYKATIKKKSLTPRSSIKDLVAQVSSGNIKLDVESLSGFKTRRVGTPDNQKATEQIKENLASLGYSTSLICYREGACSVIADKAGDGSTDQVIMIMAHLDSVGKNFAGADDNASGVAVISEIFSSHHRCRCGPL